MSTDSPSSNTKFKEKQKLPYALLCDPAATLIGAIGLKKSPKGTQRGVFVVSKAGKVLVAEPAGPAGTLAAVQKLVEELGPSEEPEKEEPVEEEEEEKPKDEEKPAEEANGDKEEED